MLITYHKGKPVVSGLFNSVEEREKAQARVEAEHEAMQKINDAALTTCPSCDQDRLEKLVSAPAIQSSGGGGGHVHGPGCNH